MGAFAIALILVLQCPQEGGSAIELRVEAGLTGIIDIQQQWC